MAIPVIRVGLIGCGTVGGVFASLAQARAGQARGGGGRVRLVVTRAPALTA